jgi:hypothetical protein
MPEIIDNLAANEEILNRLYRGYAAAFPVESEFWNALASEEVKHSAYLKDLAVKAGTSPLFINEHRFKVGAIKTFTSYLNNEISRLELLTVSLIEALSITYDIEQSLIENKYFEVFKTDSAELKQILSVIREETLSHCNRSRVELEKYQKPG